MKIEIDFVLKNDPDGKLHDLIMRNFIDQHHWFENPYKDGVECDVNGIQNNNEGLKYGRELFAVIAQQVADKKNTVLEFEKVTYVINFVAKAYKPGDKIEYGDLIEDKNLIFLTRNKNAS